MGDDVETTLAGVGSRLRAVRREHGMTLAQVAEATGISVSTVSRLESGGRRPTLDLLLPLADVYRVPLDQLVTAPHVADPRISRRPIRRHNMTMIPLSQTPGGSPAYKLVLPVLRRRPQRLPQRVHEGYDWMYVISGSLRLALGDDEYTLTAGEAAEFDTRTPHGFVNAGNRPAELLAIFSHDGESVHVRASYR